MASTSSFSASGANMTLCSGEDGVSTPNMTMKPSARYGSTASSAQTEINRGTRRDRYSRALRRTTLKQKKTARDRVTPGLVGLRQYPDSLEVHRIVGDSGLAGRRLTDSSTSGPMAAGSSRTTSTDRATT